MPHSFKFRTVWIGIVALYMEGVMMRYLPDLPFISSFPELNVRTYVNYKDKPGVWFLSLNAANPLAVWAARHFFHLPYFHARMKITKEDKQVQFKSNRKWKKQPVVFDTAYRPVSKVYESEKGSLEQWLTERYCLYSKSRKGRLYRVDVHHHPWPLQKAEADIAHNSMTKPLESLFLPKMAPSFCFTT